MASRMEAINNVVVDQPVVAIRVIGQALGEFLGDNPRRRSGSASRVDLRIWVHGRGKFIAPSYNT